MIECTVNDAPTNFHELLKRVAHGETVRIRDHGQPIARMVRDVEFLPGPDFAAIFDGYQPDTLDLAAAEEIAENLRLLEATYAPLAH
ncbi:MAG: hypothetical protein N3I86_01930 [Verrucomicrobiae bacterium]|nr:hypothetical protein [Verrucomicrobiae bacterium]MDW8308962.1 hypothetical protein [Verrucomicrobiales bacterium]